MIVRALRMNSAAQLSAGWSRSSLREARKTLVIKRFDLSASSNL
jgi:hypothetical protein